MKWSGLRARALEKWVRKIGNAIKKILAAKRKLWVGIGWGCLAVTGFLVAAQLALLIGNAMNKHNPILGLRLEHHLVGSVRGAHAPARLATITDAYENNRIVAMAGGFASTTTLRQLGVHIDQAQTYAALLQAGRTGSFWRRLLDQDAALFGRRDSMFAPSHLNTPATQSFIAALNAKIELTPKDAYFAFENQAVTMHIDTVGRRIDTQAAIRALTRADPVDVTPKVALPLAAIPPSLPASLLRPLLPQAQHVAALPLTLMANGRTTVLSRQQLVGLLVPRAEPDPKNTHRQIAVLTFDESALSTVVDTLLKQAELSPVPTIIRDGVEVQQGKSGMQPKDNQSLEMVVAALTQRQQAAAPPATIVIPMVTVAPSTIYQTTPLTHTGTGSVRLTFDDGPGAYTQQILDILDAYHVHATFYLIGTNVVRYPGDVQRILQDGNIVGNHTWDHADLTRLSAAGVAGELSRDQAAIQQACGVTSVHFRPPGGALNSTVQSVAASMGLSVDLWSVDPRDWSQPGTTAIIQRVLDADRAGSIILLHVLHQQTVDALPAIIKGIRAQGYTLE